MAAERKKPTKPREPKQERFFVVVDEQGNTSVDPKSSVGAAQRFDDFGRATRRATELSLSSPGEQIEIYERVAVLEAEVSKPIVKWSKKG